jgi:hypothetical protein
MATSSERPSSREFIPGFHYLPAPSFTLFDKLPIEIRFSIWELALPEPRIVYIEQVELRASAPQPLPRRRWDNQLWGIRTGCKPPTILFVNRESFSVASRHYQRAFACQNASYPAPGFAQTWFDFSRDLLFIDEDSFTQRHSTYSPDDPDPDRLEEGIVRGMNDICRRDIERVRNLALYGPGGLFLDEVERCAAKVLGTMGRVNNLYVVEDRLTHAYEHCDDWTFWDMRNAGNAKDWEDEWRCLLGRARSLEEFSSRKFDLETREFLTEMPDYFDDEELDVLRKNWNQKIRHKLAQDLTTAAADGNTTRNATADELDTAEKESERHDWDGGNSEQLPQGEIVSSSEVLRPFSIRNTYKMPKVHHTAILSEWLKLWLWAIRVDMDVQQVNPQVPTAGTAVVDSDPGAASAAGEDVWDE